MNDLFSLSVEELVEKIKSNNDEEAEQVLLFRYEKEVKKVVNSRLSKVRIRGLDREELYQAIRLLTITIVDKYDQSKGNFYGYWSTSANRMITSEIRSSLSKKRKTEIGQCYFLREDGEDWFENLSGNEPSIKQQYEMKEILEKVKKISDTYFSVEERTVFAYRLSGYSYQEIAKILKMSPKNVDNIMLLIRKKIRLYL